MEREEVLSLLGGCFTGEPASCSYACPFRLDLRSFLKKMSKGRFDAAYKDLCIAVPFPEITAALCPEYCAGACQMEKVLGGEAIRINALERSCLRLARRKQPPAYALPSKEQRVAVVGAGPAGLSCALTLARKKYPVTVLEKSGAWGGCLREHPLFETFERDMKLQFSQENWELITGREIRSPEELKDYDAVLLAAGEEDFGLRDGWDSELLSTRMPGVFLCGGAAGQELMAGMAAGVRCAKSIEAWLQTKNPENAREDWDTAKSCRYVPHGNGAALPAVALDGEEAYGPEGAKAEAGRCLQCDCRECMGVCELMARYKKTPPRVASDVMQDGEARNSVSTAAITRQTWSCSLCGRCAANCPEGTDIGGMLQLSRERRVESGLYPPAIHAYWLEEMAFASGEAALTIPNTGDYVFFPGCRLGADNPAYVTRSFALLRERLGAGLVLNCCGIPAWWAGERALFESHLAELRRQWETLGRPAYVLACASCRKTFRRFLPEIRTVSLYELLPPEEASERETEEVAVFDPCSAAEPEAKAAVRALASASGLRVSDFDSAGKCCGFGGHMALANPPLHREIVENRVSATELPYVVWCTNCRGSFLSGGKRSLHILDSYFGLDTPVTSLEEKRQNSLQVKRELMEVCGMGQFETAGEPWDGIQLRISPELERKMDRILVPLRCVRKVLWNAERENSGFAAPGGMLLAGLEFSAVTVWVKARRAPGEECYEVLDVYSHRMRINLSSGQDTEA